MKRLLIVFALFSIAGCVKEDVFGLSDFGRIKTISLRNQANTPLIDNDQKMVEVEMPQGVQLDSVIIDDLTLSSFASSSKNVGDVLDLSSDAELTVITESGTTVKWTIRAIVASATPQLNNNDFELWYQTGDGYYEPGESTGTTIWGTGNPGTQIIGILSTTRVERETGNYVVKMTTEDNGNFGIFGTPISAGTVYTGKFNSDNLDPTDPIAAIDFGTNFSGRPISVSFDYKYEPGTENRDRDKNLLNYPDSCDVYALLEVRNGTEVKRLATAWFRSSETVTDYNNQVATFTYGPLGDEFPDYMKQATFVGTDSAQVILPTHITFVATSSFDGAVFSGAIGSTLELDNVIMQY